MSPPLLEVRGLTKVFRQEGGGLPDAGDEPRGFSRPLVVHETGGGAR